MVVDARTELASPDMELARLLRRLGKPLFLAVNKVDSLQMEAAAENFRTLGIGQLFPVSAEHGTGPAELLDAVFQVGPAFNAEPQEAAAVAVLILDATEGVNALDDNVGGYAHESGRPVIIVVNKWDLVGPGRSDGKPAADRKIYEAQVRRNLKFLEYAPLVFVSASSGKGLDTLFKTLEFVSAERRKRIGTSQMNRFLETVDFERAGVPHRQKVRIFYMTQSHASPPTFILFTDKDVKLHFSYQRFLENQIRKVFGFIGTPIWIKNRARKKVELAKKKSRH